MKVAFTHLRLLNLAHPFTYDIKYKFILCQIKLQKRNLKCFFIFHNEKKKNKIDQIRNENEMIKKNESNKVMKFVR